MRDGKKYHLPAVLLMFFFNPFLLPHGLLYSTLLTPIFMYYIWKQQQLHRVLWAGLVLAMLGVIHWLQGAEVKSLLISNALALTVVVLAFFLWDWMKSHEAERWFSHLLKWNTLFVLMALAILPFAPIRDLLWYEVPISPGVSSFPRLKLFTYEASYYAFLFTPVFLYYFWQLVLQPRSRWLSLAIAIGLPLLLSLSFGVIGALVVALVLVIVWHWSKLNNAVAIRKLGLYGLGLSLLSILILLIVYPDNPVFERITNIFSGRDTSAKGRLVESFMFAFDLANSKSLLVGVGLGQIKILAHDLIVNYYQYEGDFAEIVRIPNCMAEWLATFGILGFLIKIGIEVYFFRSLRLHLNYFNLSLFVFVFIYQFTGSFLVSTAEIILWCIAFCIRPSSFEIQET